MTRDDDPIDDPIERGVGQSGYTAGRRAHDAALARELEADYVAYPRGSDEDLLKDELGTDDRFTGRGGADALARALAVRPRARTGGA